MIAAAVAAASCKHFVDFRQPNQQFLGIGAFRAFCEFGTIFLIG